MHLSCLNKLATETTLKTVRYAENITVKWFWYVAIFDYNCHNYIIVTKKSGTAVAYFMN